MNIKLLRLKHKSMLLTVWLALLLAFASVSGGSAGLAEAELTPKDTKTPSVVPTGFEPESAPSNSLESRVKEPTTGGPALDTDVLDIEGEWTVTQRIPAGTRVVSGYEVPSGVDPPWIYRIRLTRIGPNGYGGYSFKGRLIDSPNPGTFYGDTLYGGRGVQLVQMRFEEDTSDGKYYKLFCGKHQVYKRDPKRVEVLGGWVDVGELRAASGNNGSFVMVKGGR